METGNIRFQINSYEIRHIEIKTQMFKRELFCW